MGKKITNVDKKNIDKKIKQQNSNPKNKKILISIICIVLIIATLIPVINHLKKDDKILDTKTYVTIGDNKYTLTQTQYSFYYTLTINNFCSLYKDYLTQIGLDLSKDLSTQYYDATNKISWRDYFIELTNVLVQTTYSLYDNANSENYKNDNDNYYNSFLTSIKQDAKNQNISYEEKLKTTFFEYMTPTVFENELKIYSLSLNYTEYLNKKIKKELTEEEYEAFYEKNKDNCDTIYYRAFLIDYNKDATKDDFANNKFTKETAKTLCENVSLSKNQTDFIKLAKENAKGSYIDLYKNDDYSKGMVTGKTALKQQIADWLYSKDRKENDITVIHDEVNNRYYTILFISRERNETETVNFRHILLTYDTYKANGKTESEFIIAANAIYTNLEKGGFDRDDFIKNANNYSEDKVTDGLYENVVKDTLDPEIDKWLFDKDRKNADCELIKIGNKYHILYFEEFDVPYWKAYSRQLLSSDKYNELVDSNIGNYKLTFADGTTFNSLEDLNIEEDKETTSTEEMTTKEESTTEEITQK